MANNLQGIKTLSQMYFFFRKFAIASQEIRVIKVISLTL